MKPSDLHGMSDDVLALTLSDTEKSIFNLRFLGSTDKKNTSSEVKKAKKDIARVKYEQRRRELAKFATLSDAALDAAIVASEAKVGAGLPGKRRAQRTAVRLTDIRIVRAIKAATAAPTTPKPATSTPAQPAAAATTGKGK